MQRYHLSATTSRASGKGDLSEYGHQGRRYSDRVCCFGSWMIVDRGDFCIHETWWLDVWNPIRQTSANIIITHNDNGWSTVRLVCVSDRYSFWIRDGTLCMANNGEVVNVDIFETNIMTETYKRYCATGDRIAEFHPSSRGFRFRVYDIISMQLVSSIKSKSLGSMDRHSTIGSDDQTTAWSVHSDDHGATYNNIYRTDMRVCTPEKVKTMDSWHTVRFLPMVDENHVTITNTTTAAILDARNCDIYTLDQPFADDTRESRYYYST